jgi:hypothetical protein
MSEEVRMAETEKMTLGESLRAYWLNLLAMALIPLLIVLANEAGFRHPWIMSLVPWTIPLMFFGLSFFGLIVPYRMGRAPVGYLIVACLVFFFLGSGLAVGALYLFGEPLTFGERKIHRENFRANPLFPWPRLPPENTPDVFSIAGRQTWKSAATA